jgi:hypothetical protein
MAACDRGFLIKVRITRRGVVAVLRERKASISPTTGDIASPVLRVLKDVVSLLFAGGRSYSLDRETGYDAGVPYTVCEDARSYILRNSS